MPRSPNLEDLMVLRSVVWRLVKEASRPGLDPTLRQVLMRRLAAAVECFCDCGAAYQHGISAQLVACMVQAESISKQYGPVANPAANDGFHETAGSA